MEKKIINITNSIWSKRVYRKITIGQVISIGISCLLTLLIAILLAIYTNLIWTISISLFLVILNILFNVKQCFVLKIFWLSLKWLFSPKFKKTKNWQSIQGIIKTNKKQFIFFEINVPQQVGSQVDIERKILDSVTKLSKFTNWSIINTQLPFNELKNNKEFIDNKLNEYIENHVHLENDPIFKNIVTNKYLIDEFTNGDINKNTFLFCLELPIETKIESISQEIKYLNSQLAYQNFEIKLVDDEIMNSIKENLFLFNKKIINKRNSIIAADEFKNKQYYHFFKIKSLPSIVDEGFLDFLNSINLRNAIINFSINTYEFGSIKKESKIWENAIKNVEYELDRAIKYKDKIQSEHNMDAILEINQELVQNQDTTQKYEIICSIIANNYKDLIRASHRVKEIIKKSNQFELEISYFNQFKYFYDFQRNILGSKLNKKVLNILPNNLILFSYPFMIGNNYLNKGWFTGQLINGNPIFLDLNAGQKQNNSSLIIGKTGSGKSTFINFLIKNNMSSQNIQTILFDPKGEYSLNPEIQAMNPKIISLNDDNELSLNPFELSIQDDQSSKIEFIVNYLKIWFTNTWNDELNNYVTKTLVKCIKQDKWNIDSFLENLTKLLPNSYCDRKVVLDTIKNLTSKGIYSYFSNKTNIDIQNNLVIFDLHDLLINFNNLNKIKLLLIFKYLKNFIYSQNNLKNTNNKIQIIVDEFPALANPSAPFVVTEFVSLIRLIRSYDASLILTMQDVVRLTSGDIASNESLKSVANNVEHKFLMSMNSEQLNIMKSIWGDSVELSQEEEYEITTKFSYGDILYINKSNRYYFNSTDPNLQWSLFDKEEIDNYVNYVLEKQTKSINESKQQTKSKPKNKKS
ncbi:MAG: DUF87 domain-containing protein [Ureaplasma sp.]|nr:DUF87 domain-containing protein [Ureaplasma sp.]